MSQVFRFFVKAVSRWGVTLALIVPMGALGGQKGETVVYSFTGQSDGAEPHSSLIEDEKGNLYGTAIIGGTRYGARGHGTVFKITPGGEETTVYSFTDKDGDGAYPDAGLIADKAGNLYGTTAGGGTCGVKGRCGTIFKIAPDGVETVLYRFRGGNDGYGPEDRLLADHQGNLYGTTPSGGGSGCADDGCGTIFKLAPDGTETVLYSFCAQRFCADGMTPGAGLIEDKNGNLFGTTEFGGQNDQGTIFELSSDAAETVLYSFCNQQGCLDGELPFSELLMDNSGNLYGTTSSGGQYGGGTIFEFAPDGSETVLHSFCSRKHCADGRGRLPDLLWTSRAFFWHNSVRRTRKMQEVWLWRGLRTYHARQRENALLILPPKRVR